jgi:hypothetical protein
MSNATRLVGIDLHRRRSQIAIIDEHGEITQQRISTGRQTFTDAPGEPNETYVALEATHGWETSQSPSWMTWDYPASRNRSPP